MARVFHGAFHELMRTYDGEMELPLISMAEIPALGRVPQNWASQTGYLSCIHVPHSIHFYILY